MSNILKDDLIEKIIEAAIVASKNAYSPYSHFQVGAALLLEDGSIYTGCNIENISYGATNCAERTAIFKAVSEGHRDDLKAIAIYGAIEGQVATDYAYPCGMCRQVMSEFASDDFLIFVVKNKDDYKTFTIRELLPADFNAI